MIGFNKSEELMVAKEAQYIADLQGIPGMNADVLAAMSSLYRAGWRDCWMAEAVAQLDKDTDDGAN
jgi:hypothetical protein